MTVIATEPTGPGGQESRRAPPDGRAASLLTRFLLAAVVLLGVAVVLAAAELVFENVFVFFGEHPSRREDAVVAQACMIGLWGAGSVVAAAVAGTGRGLLGVIAASWTAALLAATPWRWLPPPSATERDYGDVPMWMDGSTRFVVWGLAAFGVASGLSLAWHNGRTARIVASCWAVSIMLVLTVSAVEMRAHRRAEAPFTPASTEAALLAAEAEQFWTVLPSGQGTTVERELGTSASWRDDEPSVVEWRGRSVDPLVLLEDVVDVAERTGWSVASATCDAHPSVNMTKDVGSEPTTLMVGVAPDHGGLVIRMRVGQPDRYLGHTIERC